MGLRKLSPGGHEYLTNAVACADRKLEPGELLSDYYLSHGYPAGQWFGAGAEHLGLSGAVSPAQMQALFGEGRNPNADAIEAELIADGHTSAAALAATKLGRAFPKYSALDHLRSKTAQAYKDHNLENGRPIGAPIDATTRAELRRSVHIQAFKDDNDGAEPETDAELAKWLAEQQKALKSAVSGFEMVFAPDKSVSIAWAMAGPEDREKIADIIRQAARDTLSYVERNLAYTRRGAMGEAQVDVDGVTVALFEHWDSRASDPHFHIHALISTKVRRSDDGQWTALDGRTILAGGVTASEYFDSRTRDLFREQGAAWSQRPANGVDVTRGIWQLAAVPLGLVKGFSQRHTQFEAARARRIVDFRAKHGREPYPKEIFEIDRQAQYDARPGKQPAKTLAEHVRAWREHAATLVPASLLDSLGWRVFHGPAEQQRPVDLAALARVTRDAVSENYSHFSRWNLEAEAHRQSAHVVVPADEREKLVTAIGDTVLAQGDTVALLGPALVEEPPFLRRRDGSSVFHEHNSTRYTTLRTLQHEADLVTWARRGGGHRLRADTVEKALAGTTLNAGQRKLVTEFARSGQRLQLALAPAGTGKTSTMKVFAAAWRRTGHRVYAFGPSARAAQELGAAIGATPHTLHQLTTAKALGFAHRMFPIQPGDMVIIDEAAMAGTHTLHTVVTHVLRRGGDVRLIGDDKQLAAVEAGGVIRLIAHDVGALRLREIVRFIGSDGRKQASASLKIRDGDPNGLKYYFKRGRVVAGSVETMRDAAHRAWRADLDSGQQSLLIVPTNEDTVALNLEARDVRLRRGDIAHGPRVELHDGTNAGVGDWVVTRHNERLLSLFGGKDFVKNGDTWTVVGLHSGGRITLAHRAHGATITLPHGYVQAHVELGYAATVNRVQGMTSTGNAHLLVPPTMTLEQIYPGVTRAMLRNFLYVITHHHVIDQHQETPLPQTPLEVLTGVLHHSGAEVSATERLRAELDAEVKLGTLVKRYNYAATYRDDERYRAILHRRAPATLDRDSEPALIQTLRNAADLGWQPDQLVTLALGRSSLDKADDPGAVLLARVTKYIAGREPPAGLAPPRAHDVTRWRGIIDAIVPAADVENPTWEPVWRRAAGGRALGFHIDATLTLVAHQLAGRHTDPYADPMPDHRYADNALAAELAVRTERGEAHQPAVPWLARPDFAAARDNPGHADYLHHTNEAIRARVEYLRAEIIRRPPAWAARLGPRPGNPIAAADWDELAGLAAGYRETFAITSTDPDTPLGARPDSHGAKARAWRDITNRWFPLATTSPTEAVPATDGTERARFGEMFTPDDVVDTLGGEDDRFALEPLNVLVRRHDLLVRDGDEDRFLALIARHAPDAVGPAETALVYALSRAQDHGWQADRLLPTVAADTRIGTAESPAALLAARVSRHVQQHTPPPRIAEPRPDDIAHWRTLVVAVVPDAAVETDAWDLVWRHAAAGRVRGLDVDTALTTAAQALAGRPSRTDPVPDPRYTRDALVRDLDRQYATDAGQHPGLPWLATADLGAPGDHTGKAERLRLLTADITERVAQLRDAATANPPQWARTLGPRPSNPELAAEWDTVLGLVAAYRETYGIRDTTRPLGHQPLAEGPRAAAWTQLTERWDTLGAGPIHTVPAPPAAVPATAEADFDGLFADLDPDRFALETLDVLVRRHDLLARDGDENRFLDLIARYVPDAINTSTETAAVNSLSRAQDRGWQAERLLPHVVDGDQLSWARDPATVLAKRINDYTAAHEPPARIAAPADLDVARWREIVTATLPDTVVRDEQWGIVWRHAAAGVVTGLDADAALDRAVQRLSETDSGETGDLPVRAAHELVAELTRKHRAGDGHHPSLPWLGVADFGSPGDHSGRIDRLAGLNAEITERVAQLRNHVARERPAWAATAGARPDDPVAAQRWDETIGLAAAYRETYRVRSDDASSPLGQPPTGNGPKADAWRQITEQWRQLMTTPDREDRLSEAMLREEAHADVRDALNAEFDAGAAAEAERLRDEDDAQRAAARRDDLEDDDFTHDRGEGLHHGY